MPATRGTCPVCSTKMFRMGETPAHAGLDPEEHMVVSKGKKPLQERPKMVIVESPAKARTVGRFLGRGYLVRASVGHVRDLPSNRMGVDIENDFEPRYIVPAKRKDVVRELRGDVRKSSEVYVATDPDREGEAIAWHLVEALSSAIGLRPVKRVEFHEITGDAIEQAFAHPRQIDMQRVEAQQARRILDRIVGYTLSPLLRDKMGRRGLSAGRVQSVAVRLVVDREREIEAFVPVEYWSIEAELAKQEAERDAHPSFTARLHRIRGQELELHSQAEVQVVVDELERSVYTVTDVTEGQRRRRPSPPFTTSTMQQEASRQVRFTARSTMRYAQQLYEGIDLGDGPVGLITYMRTDSVNVAEQAQAEARVFIVEQYGEGYAPSQPPVYKTKAKGAQEAHEAIRPTSVSRTPKSLKPYLDRNQYRLYQLIWRRFIASQMAAAVYDTIGVEILAGLFDQEEKPYLFRASGSSLRFKGFLAVYEEAKDEEEGEELESTREQIPPLTVDETLDLVELRPDQHFTQPPPRYSEATLVKALEEYGIGRPSTYAPILSTIQQRGYVERRDSRLYPTEVGVVVNDLLVEYFPDYIDVGFTAQMEDDLDLISSGEREWVPVLRDFYAPFAGTLAEAQERMPEIEMGNQPTGEVCPRCGHPLIYKYGRFGKFIGCSNFPTCRYRASILVKIGVPCPECGGELVEKRTRRGRTFYGCANYDGDDPNSCQFAVWKRPLPQPCPECGGLLTEARKGWVKCSACEQEFELDQFPDLQSDVT
ncbi:MAG TPA: type I DNA topoisomerase [Chloroflexi bacterium]|nr:type I DNA topoisomerase [Chloroflexota bacterium]